MQVFLQSLKRKLNVFYVLNAIIKVFLIKLLARLFSLFVLRPANDACKNLSYSDISSVAAALAEKLQEKYEDLEVELNGGGQPIYYYILSVE